MPAYREPDPLFDPNGVPYTSTGTGPDVELKPIDPVVIDNAGKEVLQKVQETYDLVKPEAENLVKNVLDSGKRLDAKPRVVSSVPNSILIYGGLALVLYLVFKK
jgi:hypothetical protein